MIIADQSQRTNPQINAKDFTARLPQELASNVMASLNCPADRLMLALTCKHWASTFEHVKAFSPGMPFTTLEVVRTKAGKNTKTSRGGNATSSTRIKSNKPKQTDQLKVFLRLDRWINPRYRPCYVCMKYFRRDVKQSEKLKVRGIQTFFMSGKVHGPNDAFSAKGGPSMKKVQDNGPRCPDCSARRQIRVVRESIEYGKLLRQARTLSK